MNKLFVIVWIVFGIYMMVLLSILADLWSGLRKAKKNGIVRSSYGFKRTVDKVARYYNALIALTLVDAMQMASLWYLETYYEYHIPIFPFVTLGGAVGLCIIEIKSIYEKAEDKVRVESLAKTVGEVIAHRDDVAEIAKAVGEYMKNQENKE